MNTYRFEALRKQLSLLITAINDRGALKRGLLLAALCGLFAAPVFGDTFSYSYTFATGRTVSGTFTGTQSGNYVVNVSKISVSFAGSPMIAFNGPPALATNILASTPEAWGNSYPPATPPVISIDITQCNFVFWNGTPTSGGGTSWFYISNLLPGVSSMPYNPKVTPSDGERPVQSRWSLKNLSAPAADIQMISATAPDSNSVRFSYTVSGSAVPSFEIGVYRSPLPVFDGTLAVQVASTTVFNAIPGSTYTGTVTVPLKRDTLGRYVLVVADPRGLVPETNKSNNVAKFQKWSIAIISHGLQLTPTNPLNVPEWEGRMGAALTGQGYDRVIEFSWAGLSRNPAPNQTTIAALNLVNSVRSSAQSLPLAINDVVDSTWIGHSRGAVVVGQALQTLNSSGLSADDIVRHGWIKMVMLDPHPARNPLWASSNPGELGWLASSAAILFQDATVDPDAFFPSAAVERELYFQRTEWFFCSPISPEYILNLWGGSSISGVTPVEVTSLWRGHSEVPDWYLANKIQSPTASRFSAASVSMDSASLSIEESDVLPLADPATVTDMDILYPLYVDNQGLAQSIISKLTAAHAASDRGDISSERNILGALNAELRAQRGKHITAEFADFLTSASDTLITVRPKRCNSQRDRDDDHRKSDRDGNDDALRHR